MHSNSFNVRIRGPLAVFTRPEMKAERVSYEVMTPSAARGVLEAILWKPAISWVVEEVAVLAEIRWTSFRRNEVNSKAPRQLKHDYYADADRSQRNTVALRDVDYVVKAHFEMTDKVGDGDSVKKFEEMFLRRTEKGQSFHQPYLGCREMAADVSLADGGERPISLTKPLGLMFFDFDYEKPAAKASENETPPPLFFDARLDGGVMRIPTIGDVRVKNGVGQ